MNKALVLSLLAGITGLYACTEISSDSPIDCNSYRGYFIELDPALPDLFGYRINAGDSIRVTGSVRRADSATPAFNPLQGWHCVTTASSPVTAVVTLTTTDTQILRIGANGWIRGFSSGVATVVASAANPPVSTSVGFLVYPR